LKTQLHHFKTNGYIAGPKIKIFIWYIVNYGVFYTSFPWPYAFKRFLLRLFGAKVGTGVIIKTNVRIKNPWRLQIGDNCWLGESVWIDNLADVCIGSDVCISQGAMLLTGNHDFTKSSFPYRLGEIVLENGVWIGARSVICPGIICKTHSVLTVNSVASKNLEQWGIYSGSPAILKKTRTITE
jgi:putative colanic acid biosynthesis acetyltransferase WcaF